MSVVYETDIAIEKKIGPQQALALQTYEFFEGGPERKPAVGDFASGVTCNLQLKYPDLEGNNRIDEYVSVLLKEISNDPTEIATPEYRLAEAYFLKAAVRLNSRERAHSQDTIDNFQELNEAIYGRPDPRTVNQMLIQVWSLVDRVKNPIAQELRDRLINGYEFTAADGQTVEVPPLPQPDETDKSCEPLPILEESTLEWLNETLSARYGAALELFQEYYKTHDVAEGVDADQIAELFEAAIASLDFKISVIKKENVSLLSWSSAEGAVVIGKDRKPIKTPEELFGLFVHEVGVHGVRSIQGLLQEDAFGTGLFSEAGEGEDPSYLNFEEGLAATLQSASRGKKESWTVASMGLYLSVAFAHMGWSPRQIQEVMTNLRLVTGCNEKDSEIPQARIEKAQTAAATHTRRIFRGTPTEDIFQTSSGVTLHYAKDLAYASGKVRAITHLNQLAKLSAAEREAALDQLLSAKYDPTNTIQNRLVLNRDSKREEAS